MNYRRIIGRAMLAAPFAAMFGFVALTGSLATAILLFGGVALGLLWIAIGVELLDA